MPGIDNVFSAKTFQDLMVRLSGFPLTLWVRIRHNFTEGYFGVNGG
jgi:hypothetical protein